MTPADLAARLTAFHARIQLIRDETDDYFDEVLAKYPVPGLQNDARDELIERLIPLACEAAGNL